MVPIRKSKSAYRQYINDVSPLRDADSAKRCNSKKRKFSDMLGSRWTTEEISRFYDAYRKYSTDWKKVAGAVRNRSPEMVEALYKMNRVYLSLPDGTASARGLIAMMTDHYINLVGSDNERESNDGSRSSRKAQKHARGKVKPTTSKTFDNHCVSHSQTIASNNGCLSLLKNKHTGGSRPRPVGKRTPRFPVSFFNENNNEKKNASSTRKGLKLNANASDDDIAHEVAVALAKVSQHGGSPHSSPTPSKRAENAMLSPFRHAQGKVITTSVGTVKEATIKLGGNEYEFEQNSHLDDTKEEVSESKEGQTFGRTSGKLNVAVTNGKTSSFSMQRQRERSKKVLFEKDEVPAFAALHTLAELSLMMQAEDDDDSKVQLQDGNDDHANGSVSGESLRVNQQKGKHKYSGVMKKGFKSRTSYATEKNQDLQLSIIETPRKKQKMQVPKIQKTAADLDIRCSGSPRVEDGDPANKLMKKKSSRSVSLNLLRNSENSSSTNLQKRGSDSGHLAGEILAVNQAHLPTKVRSKRKIKSTKLQVQKDFNSPGKLSNDQRDLSLAFNLKEKLSTCLSNPGLRKWCTYEWFYSAIDYPWFAKKEFVEYLHHVGLGHVPRLTRVEWGVIKSSLGKPRRFSEQFLKEEKEKLNKYRDSVRKHYTQLPEGGQEGWPADLARPLSVGQRVIAIHPKTREIHNGRVLTVDHSRCQVQFDCRSLGVEYVKDIDCMPLNHSEDNVDKCSENSNELKINGRLKERVKLPSGDNANESYANSQSSPSTNSQTGIGYAETSTSQQTASSQPSTHVQIQAKEADVQALSELTRALEKKEAIVVELRRMNDDAFGNQEQSHISLKDSEPYKKKYAAVLVQLNETNEQVSSALHNLRQRNTYQGTYTNFADRGGGFSSPRFASQTSEWGSHLNKIVDSSRIEARAMVDAAMQEISSFKSREDTFVKLGEAVDHVNDQLPDEESRGPTSLDVNATSASSMEAQIPSELISKCVATMLMIQKCTRRQWPPSDVAQILDRAVRSLQPRSSQNLGVYTEIQQCMGIIRNQIISLVPAST